MIRRWPRWISCLLVATFALAALDVIGVGPGTNRAEGAERSATSELTGGWHFVRTRNPVGDADAISIMHTADTSKPDLDLAGLTIRCREGGTEVLIVLMRSFSLRERPQVALGKSGNETKFEATVAPPGTAVLLPMDGESLVRGPWKGLSDLSIRINDGKSVIHGVVALEGLPAAFKVLRTNCTV